MMALIVAVCVILFSTSQAFVLNARTCEGIEDPTTYEIIELRCSFRGVGVYVYKGPSTVKKLTFDRLNEETHLRAVSKHIQEVSIVRGTPIDCAFITVSPTTVVKVNGVTCENLDTTRDMTTQNESTKPTTKGITTQNETTLATKGITTQNEVTILATKGITTQNEVTTLATKGITTQNEVTGTSTILMETSQTTATESPLENDLPWIITTVATLTVIFTLVLIIWIWRKKRNILQSTDTDYANMVKTDIN